MNIIEHDHPNNCVECCSKMLSDWLEQNTCKDTTWEVLINAIDKLPKEITGVCYSTMNFICTCSKLMKQCMDVIFITYQTLIALAIAVYSHLSLV